MALQGTIETFALPDVMRLLASTRKTGCLRLTGTRGSGSVWVEDGGIVASGASGTPHATGPVEVFFELLRFGDGDFVFDSDVTADTRSERAEVEATLAEAETMLEEWKLIEAVVPSLGAWVELQPELPAEQITIGRDRWRVVVLVGAGTTVGRLGDELEMGELPISRLVKELVDAGLVVVGEAPATATSPAPQPSFQPAPPPEPPAYTPPPSFAEDELVEETVVAFEERFETPSNGHNGADTFDASALMDAADTGAASAPEPVATATFEPDPTDAAEIARQLANLSPKAAKAVAAAAKATTVEEREAALAEVDDEEDPINRELLIKFLGSVSS